MPRLCGLSLSLSSGIKCHVCARLGVSGGVTTLLYKEVTSLMAGVRDSGLGGGDVLKLCGPPFPCP